jgi:hypothetical protein
MIIRLSQKLSKKIKELDLPAVAPHANPFLDWHARLFTHRRAQYIMVSNSTSLFSMFMHGAGVTDFTKFYERMNDTLKDVLHDIGADLIFEKTIVPNSRKVRLAKAQDRRVIGAMNDNIHFAKFVLEKEGKNLHHLSSRVNKYIHLFLKEGYPVEAFLGMKAGGDSQD